MADKSKQNHFLNSDLSNVIWNLIGLHFFLLYPSRLSSLTSKSMPTLLPSPHQQQWQGVDSDCAGAVSFSDSSCPGPGVTGHPFLQRRPESSSLLRHPNLLTLHWERHLQVKDFCMDCSNSGGFHLYSAVIQSNWSLVSVNTWQVVSVQPRPCQKPGFQRWVPT